MERTADDAAPRSDVAAGLEEREARRVLLVRAFEEADAGALVLSERERERAAARARADGADAAREPGAFLARRAAELGALLTERVPQAERLASGLGFDPGPALVVAPAFVAGLATNALGPEQHVSVLAFPMLGLIAWNLAVYAALALSALRRGASDGVARSPQPGLLTRAASAWSAWSARVGWLPAGDQAALAAAASERFLASWRRAAAPLLAARGRALLHLGSVALVAGVVAGMYLRGIAFAYSVTWESTFLDAGAAGALLRVALAPALLLSGAELPPLETLRAPADASAAPWIHLYALTALAYVGLPRMALYARERARVRRLARSVQLDLREAYFRRLLAPARGASLRALVVPYSFQPSARALERLRALLHDAFGARARVEARAPLEYGAEEAELGLPEERGEGDGAAPAPLLALVFSLAQAPEVEVHGRLLEALRARAGAALLVVVDGSAYAERMEPLAGGGERLDERRRAWDRIVRAAGLAAVHARLEQPPEGDQAARLAAAVWPPEGLSEAAR